MGIDVFSKYAWVKPITKIGNAVTESFEKILKCAKGRKPPTMYKPMMVRNSTIVRFQP